MTVISSFSNPYDLNIYLDSTLSNPQIIKINSLHRFIAFSNLNESNTLLKSLASGEINENDFEQRINDMFHAESWNSRYIDFTSVESNTTEPYYVFPWSKTIYRRSVHSNIPDSLYKKMYYGLKDAGYIFQASGSFVALKVKVLSSSSFLTDNTSINAETFSQMMEMFTALKDDNQYYISMIKNLEMEIDSLRKQNSDLEQQVINKSLTTWY